MRKIAQIFVCFSESLNFDQILEKLGEVHDQGHQELGEVYVKSLKVQVHQELVNVQAKSLKNFKKSKRYNLLSNEPFESSCELRCSKVEERYAENCVAKANKGY
jgi:hypothetical protein